MQKAMGHIRAVVSRIVFIGVSVQIVLGLFWMLFALDDRQDFVGSVYAEWLDGMFSGVSYEPIVYLLQLGVAFWAGCRLLEGLGAGKTFWKVWGSLALLTYPYAMQCHMAILPDSLAFSFFLLLLAAGLKGEKTIYLFWLLSALFLPEYLYFGAVPVVVFFVMSVKKNGNVKKISLELLLIGAVMVMAVGFHKLSATEHESLEEAWFRRTVWSSLYQFYPHWPEEVTDAITDEEYNAIIRLPENMTIVLAKVKNVLGEEYAKKWFGKFGTFVLKANREQIFAEVVKDAGGYLAPLVLVQLRLAGKGGFSYCARNYEIMRAEHPWLTTYYVDYSGIWFVVGTILILLVTIMVLVRRIVAKRSGALRKEKRSRQWMLSAGLVSGFLMVIWYTLMEPNLWDPKKALFVGCLWILAMVSVSGEVSTY